jgi:hypothetical protein
MAGSGKKTFTAGDVLTASDVNNYLMDQTVMVFAGTAARSSAIPTPSEGMFAVTTDNDQVDYYDGSAWVPALPVGAWTSYVPVWSGNGTAPTIGNGTISGNFCQIGKTVHFNVSWSLGSTSTVGTSTRYTVSLPITAKSNQALTGSGLYYDTSATNYYPFFLRNSTTLIDTMFFDVGPTSITGNVLAAAKPVVPANGDSYTITGTYEAA